MALFRYLDPKNDIAFTKIFGSEKNKDILIHFLPETAIQKQSIVDVLCKDTNGAKYIIEM